MASLWEKKGWVGLGKKGVLRGWITFCVVHLPISRSTTPYHTAQHRTAQHSTVHCDKNQTRKQTREKAGSYYKTLQPTDPPIFEVMNISINETATQVAIWGILGIAIIELPKRWGKDSAFQGGKEIILCAARTGFAWTYQEPLTAMPPNPYFKTPD
ncbi:hypothetical protein M0804_009204 [Polistes exclamans]|nr:hypothetical protein M0804_009204 [Polistes exclamans]